MLKIAYSPVYRYELPPGHRFPMEKYELLPEQLLYEGTVKEDNFFHPDKLTDDAILLTHTQEYLHKLNTQSLDRREIRDIGFPMSEQLIDRGKYIANGTLMCAEYAMQHGVAMNIAGGTHHSFGDHGEGFCIYNDIAITANVLLHRQIVQKVLVVDLDVHQGNGTAKIFQHDDRVYTFSMHGERNYPLRKEKSNLDIGLPDNTEDDYYLDILRNTLPSLVDQEEPDMIFYLSGVDILATDKLGRLNISKIGCKERDKYVLELCQKHQIPVTVSMGGGYSPDIKDIIDAHANTFRLAQEIYF